MDLLLRLVVVLGLITWAGGVAYSRWVFFSSANDDPVEEVDRAFYLAIHVPGTL